LDHWGLSAACPHETIALFHWQASGCWSLQFGLLTALITDASRAAKFVHTLSTITAHPKGADVRVSASGLMRCQVSHCPILRSLQAGNRATTLHANSLLNALMLALRLWHCVWIERFSELDEAANQPLYAGIFPLRIGLSLQLSQLCVYVFHQVDSRHVVLLLKNLSAHRCYCPMIVYRGYQLRGR
jgi:hypothetical protein